MEQAKTILRMMATIMTLFVFIMMACSKDDNPTTPEPDPVQQPDPDPDPENRAPIADAGDDRQAEIGSLVKMDASGSTDPDGDALSFKWSFASIPEGSMATIIGVGKDIAEFTMDKAGEYQIQVEVSDGKVKATDDLTVSNLTPELRSIRSFTVRGGEEEAITQRGGLMIIRGKFFSPNMAENKATLAGFECEVVDVNIDVNPEDDDRIEIIVPDDVTPGDLVLTIGSQSITWPMPFRVVEDPSVNAWVENDPALVKRERVGDTYRDIGTVFKPTVDGVLLAVGARSVLQTSLSRITVWDMASEELLFSRDLSLSDGTTRWSDLGESVLQLEADKEYAVTFITNDWFYYQTDPVGTIFPKTEGQIELVSTIYGPASDSYITAQDFPNEAIRTDYMVFGIDILFLPDNQ